MNHRLLVAALWGLGILLAALGISLLTPPFVTILQEVRERMENVRIRALTSLRTNVRPWWVEFWARQKAEPRRPIIGMLASIRRAIVRFGERPALQLSELAEQLKSDAHSLKFLTTSIDGASLSSLPAVQRSNASIAGISASVLIAGLLGALNAFLLNIFFHEVIGPYRILPYPAPDIEASLILALLFFVLEIAAGVLLSGAQSDSPSKDHGKLSWAKIVPSIIVVAALMVELVAYSLLSVKMNIPERLGLTPADALYGITKYFFACFGGAMTLALTLLGHNTAEQIAKYRATAADRSLRRALERGNRTTADYVDKVVKSVERIGTLVSQFPTHAVQEFSESIEAVRADVPLAESIQAALVRAEAGAASDSSVTETGAPISVRTLSQARADLLTYLLAAGACGTLVGIIVWQLVTFPIWTAVRSAGFAWGIALALPIGALLTSMLAANALRGSRYTTVTATAVPDPERRPWLGAVYCLVGVAMLALFGLLTVAADIVEGHPVANATLGVVEAGALMALGLLLDAILLAIWHAGHLLAIATAGAGLLAVAALAVITAAVLGLLSFVLRVLSIPGDVMRRVRSPRPPVVAAGVAS